ncbi:MAG TPA: hypothetical protein VNN62_03150, partial [Methylomirabilota bacterium]|nr:hypothetical protein [Methylomirabilota bacterium]
FNRIGTGVSQKILRRQGATDLIDDFGKVRAFVGDVVVATAGFFGDLELEFYQFTQQVVAANPWDD